MLFLCLDLAMPLETHQEEDWAFLLKAGKMEVSKLEALLLLFSLCHVVNWFCNGRAPRLDSDALRLLVKVQEFQVHCALEHRSKTNAAPLVIFVHRELEMPFSPAVPGHQVYDAVEKVLDNRWRNSLKKMKLLQDAKRSSASVLNELCQPDVFGRLFLIIDNWKGREGLAEASKEKREKLSFEDWLGTASALHLRLHATLTAAARLPEELAQAVGEVKKVGAVDHVTRLPVLMVIVGLKVAAGTLLALPKTLRFHRELYFAFNSAQEAIDEACQSFSAKLGSADSQELLEAAEQQVLQKTYTPLGACAWAVARKHCERLINMQSRPCKARCWSGRSCNLMEGHQEPHRHGFRATKVCLCGKSEVQLFEKFEPPKAAAEGIAPFGPCCHNVNFMPFLPEGCDFDMDPVAWTAQISREDGDGERNTEGLTGTVQLWEKKLSLWMVVDGLPLPATSWGLARIKPGAVAMTALPSALPEANGFLALVADAPIAVDPEGARLPGFGDQLYGLSCWHLPLAGPKEVYVGFEYVCPQGYRFLAPPYKCSGLSTGKQPEVEGKKGRRRREQTSLEEGEYESVPLCGYRLYVPCVQHRRQKGRRGDPPCISQLTRIWVQTPHRRELIQAEPRVAIVDTKGEVGSDGRPKEVIMTGGKVVLPAGMLVQLVLPYAYFRADTPVPSFWDLGHDAERCRLLPYLLTLRRPS
ncbi:Hypothetical protein SCF082_LOCUS32776 [Durusdinium trenchii]|uniref:Nonsense-mediated mRNA decay factor SMG8 n=1 Tax=Durusdinium trenchii TaxID=1381693 RepID=A0ABP0NHG6_9DINO